MLFNKLIVANEQQDILLVDIMTLVIFEIIAVHFERSSFAVSARHSILLVFFASSPTIFLGYHCVDFS